jgi:hypothetical protein
MEERHPAWCSSTARRDRDHDELSIRPPAKRHGSMAERAERREARALIRTV